MATETCRGRLLAAVAFFLIASQAVAQKRAPYIETFDDGPGGWVANRRDPLPVWDGVAYCFGPWFVDPNHAPPGAGYLHMLMFITTSPKWVARKEYPSNAFVEGKRSTNLTNARVTLRLRGTFDLPDNVRGGIEKARKQGEVPMGLQGSRLLLWVQAETQGTMANFALTGQPFQITPNWSEQTVVLQPDPTQWTCAGGRHDLIQKYGCADIADVLEDVNLDLYLVLFPLKVVPAGEVEFPQQTRAGEHYPVQQEFLPKGLLMVDTVKIEYPD